ncbi:MAG: extracellular solute-binding protein [Pseudomonadota bacterium]
MNKPLTVIPAKAGISLIINVHKTKAPRHPGQVHVMHASRDLWNFQHIESYRDSRFRGNDGGGGFYKHSARYTPKSALLSLIYFFVLIAAQIFVPVSHATETTHGLSAFGDLKYPADFKHFDYVNPDAPKGGRLSMIGTAAVTTFDSFNGYIVRGVPAQGLGYLSNTLTVFDQLMVRAWDEPDSVYGLVAHSAKLSADKKSVTFYLRPEARFADGSKLTADDVIFTFQTLKEKGHPAYAFPLKDVTKATKVDDRTVRYHFQGDNVRDLPLIVAQLPIFSKAYYTKHDFSKTSLEPPLGSGPYKITNFKQGTFVTYKRREDYWAKDLPVNVGRFNFDELRYNFYRDRTIEFEALKSGRIDLREEFTSKVWATQYKNLASVKSGKLKLEVLDDNKPSGAQGFFINTRRAKFQDRRVREALGMAFDFEWTNKNQFYNLYERTHSYFENSSMKAEGKPSSQEQVLLAPFKGDLPPDIFQDAFSPPVSNGSGQDRNLLRQAAKLLKQAGWEVKNRKRVNSKGEIFTIEFLIFSPGFERIITPFVKNLKILGIDASIRRVDSAQYQERMKAFDFDIIIQRFVGALTPGVTLRNRFTSETAHAKASNNLAGIQSKAVDALVDTIIQAKSRAELTTATRVLDRVLRAGHYWVPHWYKASHHLAYWDKFSQPKMKPKYHRGVLETWWYDEKKAQALQGK